MVVCVGLSVYLLCIFMFMFKTNSLVRVLIIVVSSISMGLVIYSLVGFSWYLLLFIIVYVGGVYILFIYVSMVMPNSGLFGFSWSLWGIFSVFLALCLLFTWYLGSGFVYLEQSHYVCSESEGLLYLFLCVMLLCGMSVVSLMGSLGGGWLR